MKGDKNTKKCYLRTCDVISLLAHNKTLCLVCYFHPQGKTIFICVISTKHEQH